MTSINIWSTDATRTPWLGFGIEWDAETNDIQPLQLSQQQWDMLYTRVDYMHPAWIRSMIDVQWFCPEGIVGRYTFNSPSMQAWYPILDYARARNIPLSIGTWDMKPWDYHTNQYATALSDLLHHLIHERGYSNIRYTNGVNEPDSKLPSFQDWEAFNLPVAASKQGKNGELVTQVPANSLVMLTSLDTGPDYVDPTSPNV